MSANSVRYKVVVNDEEQFSIWPASRPTPAGWRETGHSGTQVECLDHIEQVWHDVLPLSSRRPRTSLTH
ncbi:MAG TPA: MbtH family protein [Pseudonocardiaceae bacterium]